jgi:hypothetical protein
MRKRKRAEFRRLRRTHDVRVKGARPDARTEEAGVRMVNPMLTALNYGLLHVTIKVLCEIYLPKVIKINLHDTFFIR